MILKTSELQTKGLEFDIIRLEYLSPANLTQMCSLFSEIYNKRYAAHSCIIEGRALLDSKGNVSCNPRSSNIFEAELKFNEVFDPFTTSSISGGILGLGLATHLYYQKL